MTSRHKLSRGTRTQNLQGGFLMHRSDRGLSNLTKYIRRGPLKTRSPHLRARHNVDTINTSENGRRKLGPEGIPHTVLDLRRCAILARWGLHRYKLLAIHSLRVVVQSAGRTILQMLLVGNECVGRGT